MIPKEILQQIKRIEISTRSIVSDMFSGEYHSVFKGQGLEFSEVRAYQPGDNVRLIDWNVSARMGHPYIKKFEETRELTVMLSCRHIKYHPADNLEIYRTFEIETYLVVFWFVIGVFFVIEHKHFFIAIHIRTVCNIFVL